jgi:hypothetical protein
LCMNDWGLVFQKLINVEYSLLCSSFRTPSKEYDFLEVGCALQDMIFFASLFRMNNISRNIVPEKLSIISKCSFLRAKPQHFLKINPTT